ncbi:MAG: hypothetical protein IT371_18785 [Deltaproteobacteria bacterium]|nr:hypothetical protein [Deltaproteobacteria bacterium]
MRSLTPYRLTAALAFTLALGMPLASSAAEGQARASVAERARAWLIGRAWTQKRLDNAVQIAVYDRTKTVPHPHLHTLFTPDKKSYSGAGGLSAEGLVSWSSLPVAPKAFMPPKGASLQWMTYHVTKERIGFGDLVRAALGLGLANVSVTAVSRPLITM